jgi:phage shock protein PspC (stress-responsive transcriptional regulator)
MAHRIYRSSTDRVIGGVAGGIAEAFDFNPTFVRILFATLIVMGVGIPIYLLLMILLPRDPALVISFDEPRRSGFWRFMRAAAGIFIVIVLTHRFGNGLAVAASIIGAVVGFFYLWRSRGDADGSLSDFFSRFHRSADDRKITGVFGGLAESFDLDPTLLRVIGVVLLVCGGHIAIAAYLLFSLVVPVKREVIII